MTADEQPGEEVALGADDLAPRDQALLEPEDLLELGVVRLLEHAVLELVDAVVELGQLREEAVDQRVDDPVERQRRLERRRAALGGLAAQVGEGGAVVVVHGEQVLLGEKAVHLHEPVAVGVGAVGDEVDVAVELLELGPLAEVLGVLDGQGVEAEGLAQQRRVARPSAGAGRARRTHLGRGARRRRRCRSSCASRSHRRGSSRHDAPSVPPAAGVQERRRRSGRPFIRGAEGGS